MRRLPREAECGRIPRNPQSKRRNRSQGCVRAWVQLLGAPMQAPAPRPEGPRIGVTIRLSRRRGLQVSHCKERYFQFDLSQEAEKDGTTPKGGPRVGWPPGSYVRAGRAITDL